LKIGGERKRRRRFIPMIVDAHYHLEEQLETVEALLKQMKMNDVQRVALIPKMNEPFHLKPIPKKASGLLPPLLMSRLRFLGLVLYNSTVTSDGKLSTLGTKYELYHKPDNSYIHHTMREHPDRFFGWMFINPRTMNSMEEVERWAGKQGWVGVKTHPFWHGYPVDMLDDVAGYCEETNLPILMHLGGDRESGDYRYLPERHPGLRIIYAHAAVPYFREVWNYAKEKENVFVDLSSLIYTDQGVLSSVIGIMGAEKCLYGTDGPYADATQKRMLDRILQLSLSDYERERILGRNFLELVEA
jgi:predicted TIM-barrel fold metal-dependent hydrolase